MLYFLSLFFSFIVFSNGDPFVCNGTISISAPANLSNIVYYPNNWNESLTLQQYASNQECRWNIEVPQGYWAYMTISASTPSPSTLHVIYANGKEENVYETVANSPFALIAPKYSIVLKAAANKVGTLGVKISYIPMPEFNPDNHLLSATEPEIITNPSACVITAPTSQVSLVASNAAVVAFYYFTRFFVVYDGPNTNSTYLGSLYDALESGKQLVSSGRQLTVVNLFPQMSNLGNYIMVQDYSNVKQFSNYRFSYCITFNCNMILDATNGSAAVVTLSTSNVYLKSVQVPQTSSLSVYYGAIKSSNIVHVYKSNNTISPQKLNNYMTTFVLDSGVGTVGVNFDNMLSNWMLSSDGKTGYITSPKYGIISPYQAVAETFNGDDYYNYTTRIVNHGLVGSATLQITTRDKAQKVIDDHTYTKDSLPPTTQDVHPGKSLSITYMTNGENTTGILMDFSIAKAQDNGAMCNGTNSISAPADLSSIYYPNTWNQSTTVPQFALNQECRWDIEVPQGQWAFVTLDAVIPNDSTLKVIYVNGKEENLQGTVSNNPFAFITPSFSIVLKASGSTVGALAFKVDYFAMPAFNPDSFILTATDSVVVPNMNLTACVITVPTSQVSLIASSAYDISFYYFTRLFAVFDGPDTNSAYLGNLFDVFMSGTQLVSTGKQLTVVNLYPVLNTIGNFILVQDYSNVKQFSNYRFASNYHIGSDSNFVLDATNGTAAVVTLSANNLYLKSVQVTLSSSLSIYYGSIKSSNIVHVYKSNNNAFPQKLNNYMTTFVLDSNVGNIEISSDDMMSSWNNAVDGKTGYITSPKYGIPDIYQAIIETFIGDDYYNYTTQIIDHGLIGDATLRITTYDKSNEIVDDHTYTKDNLPPTTQDVHPGKSMSVTYQTNGSNTTGVLLDFSVSSNSVSNVPVPSLLPIFEP